MTEPKPEPTMNDRLRLKPPVRDIFAKYRVEDTTDTTDTDTTDPKETDQ